MNDLEGVAPQVIERDRKGYTVGVKSELEYAAEQRNLPKQRQKLIDDFEILWYEESAKGLTWKSMTYFGYKMWKCPFDLHLYAEVICQVHPALIIETGTAFGASALYFAHLCDQLGQGKVLSIDLNPIQRTYPTHPRIAYEGGRSSTDPVMVKRAHHFAEVYGGPVLVILDSDHTLLHVRSELNNYADMVTPGSFLIVEDVNINSHPVAPAFGPGPYEAVQEWLPRHPEFVLEARLPARMLFSFNAWLRKERT